MNDDARVQETTRRVVGYAALRRASQIVQGWRRDEEEKRYLLPRVATGMLLFAMLAAGIFFVLRPFG